MTQSEVARIREKIELEYQAAQQVFIGFTPTGRHDYIAKRQESIEACYQELIQYIEPAEAIQVIIQAETATHTRGESHASS